MMESDLIKFSADKILMRGPKVDGSYQVTLEVGEYEVSNLVRILQLGGKKQVYAVVIKPYDPEQPGE
jgi:hypothetical protein